MVFEATLTLTAYVDVDQGDELAVGDLVRDKLANGPLLFVAEGARAPVGHYLVKGMSAKVESVRPYVGNRRVMKREEGSDEED